MNNINNIKNKKIWNDKNEENKQKYNIEDDIFFLGPPKDAIKTEKEIEKKLNYDYNDFFSIRPKYTQDGKKISYAKKIYSSYSTIYENLTNDKLRELKKDLEIKLIKKYKDKDIKIVINELLSDYPQFSLNIKNINKIYPAECDSIMNLINIYHDNKKIKSIYIE